LIPLFIFFVPSHRPVMAPLSPCLRWTTSVDSCRTLRSSIFRIVLLQMPSLVAPTLASHILYHHTISGPSCIPPFDITPSTPYLSPWSLVRQLYLHTIPLSYCCMADPNPHIYQCMHCLHIVQSRNDHMLYVVHLCAMNTKL